VWLGVTKGVLECQKCLAEKMGGKGIQPPGRRSKFCCRKAGLAFHRREDSVEEKNSEADSKIAAGLAGEILPEFRQKVEGTLAI